MRCYSFPHLNRFSSVKIDNGQFEKAKQNKIPTVKHFFYISFKIYLFRETTVTINIRFLIIHKSLDVFWLKKKITQKSSNRVC